MAARVGLPQYARRPVPLRYRGRPSDCDHPVLREIANLDATVFGSIMALPDGYQDLPKTPTSGALDYLRSQLLSSIA